MQLEPKFTRKMIRKISWSYLKAVIHQPIKSWWRNFGKRSHCICCKSPNVIIWYHLSFLRKKTVMKYQIKEKKNLENQSKWGIVSVSPLHCQHICRHRRLKHRVVPSRLPFLPNHPEVFRPLLTSGYQLPSQNLPIQFPTINPNSIEDGLD